jgi:hypothetical protein
VVTVEDIVVAMPLVVVAGGLTAEDAAVVLVVGVVVVLNIVDVWVGAPTTEMGYAESR